MDSEKNNQIHINTFSGGMNTDLADSVIKPEQYRLSNNVRFTTNVDENTGELHLIDGTEFLYNLLGEIIHTHQINDYGVVFTKSNNIIRAYRIDYENKERPIELIFGPCVDWEFTLKLSTAHRIEDENNVKLYVADGIHSLLIIDVFPKNGSATSVDAITTNINVKLNAPRFINIISGSLKSGLNLYSYLVYSKYKQSSQISPATKLIPIVNKGIDGYVGVKQGSNTNSGVQIQINTQTSDIYDIIKLYRIHYDLNGSLPEIDVIYEGKYTDTFVYNDVTNNSLLKLTLEEYNGQSGIYIIPSVIESKDDYLFAGFIIYR